MSLTSSLYSGVSGLTVLSEMMSVIGNNISNVNTIGFKKSRATFEDMLYQEIAAASGTSQIGRGVALSTISTSFIQGSFESTNEPTDLAIGGKGFFMVRDPNSDNTYYTRAGQFTIDKKGNLCNPEGYILRGWEVIKNPDGSISTVGAIKDINIPQTSASPKTTSQIQIAVNLDATSNIPADFDLSDKSGTSNYSTSLVVYDSLGSSHPITIYFRKVDNDGNWQWFAVVDASNTASGNEEVQAAGTLKFNKNGVLTDETQASAGQTVGNYTVPNGFSFSGGATPNQQIEIKFGTQQGAPSKSTQFSSPSSTIFQTQDGYGSGFLLSISVDTDGVISGHYSNGVVKPLYKISLAKFQNPWGLRRKGGNMFIETRASGQAITGFAGAGGLGNINPNSLEQSNVDLAEEFVRMIITQRNFQANSRVITTTDEMLTEIINLKR